MNEITKEVVDSYLKWNLYILKGIKANQTNSKGMIKVTLALGLSIAKIMFSDKPNKREEVLSTYQQLLSAFLHQNKESAMELIADYNKFTESLNKLKPKINQDRKVGEAEVDTVLQRLSSRSKPQA